MTKIRIKDRDVELPKYKVVKSDEEAARVQEIEDRLHRDRIALVQENSDAVFLLSEGFGICGFIMETGFHPHCSYKDKLLDWERRALEARHKIDKSGVGMELIYALESLIFLIWHYAVKIPDGNDFSKMRRVLDYWSAINKEGRGDA